MRIQGRGRLKLTRPLNCPLNRLTAEEAGAGEPGGGISGRASRQYPSYGTNMPGVGEEAPTPAKSVPVDAKAKIEQVDLRIEELRALKAEAEADESRIALLGVTLEKLEEELRLALRRRAMLLLLILISNEVF